MTSTSDLTDFCRWLARPVLLFYALPWLMVLLVIGTLSQADVGLYQAHRLYFSSWFFWFGPLPLPGAWPTLALITLSLTVKFWLGSPWDGHKLGTTLTHLGVLLLLYGGLAAALTQREGFIAINEGARSGDIASYHDRVLKIFKDGALIEQIPIAQLKEGGAITSSLPFSVTPTLICRNCSAETKVKKDTSVRHGMAQKITLIPVELETQDELNLSGLMFTVSGAGDADGLYASLEDVPMIPRFEVGDHVYGLQMGRAVETLPFSIELVDFMKQDYPGTTDARAYHSDVIVHDGDLSWPARIEMNEPLRYKGYTLYQSSFAINPDGSEKTVLSAVRNKGWLFPYLASAIIFAGLCMHLFQRLQRART